MKLTKAQRSRLAYMAREHVGGRSLLLTAADYRIFSQLDEAGLVSVTQTSPGFLAAHITEAGRSALKGGHADGLRGASRPVSSEASRDENVVSAETLRLDERDPDNSPHSVEDGK